MQLLERSNQYGRSKCRSHSKIYLAVAPRELAGQIFRACLAASNFVGA